MRNFVDYQQLEISEFETSSIVQKYLLSYNGHYFEINKSVAELVCVLKNSLSLEDIVEYYKNKSKSYSIDDIESIITKVIDPIFSCPEKKKSFLVRREIISKEKAWAFSKYLKYLLKKEVVLVAFFCLTILSVLFFYDFSSKMNLYVLDFYTLLITLLLFLTSSFFHELGHISACEYYKVDHGGIGLALYLNFPVFYSNISQIWSLSRRQRFVVNISGVYFQLLFLIPAYIFYFYTQSVVCKYYILSINLNILITLNPFFKFDGYWIMTDLLGVPNLRQRTNEYIKFLFMRLVRNKTKEKPSLCSIKKNMAVMTIIYTIIVNVFFLYYFLYIIPIFLYNFFKTYPNMIEKLVLEISMGKMPTYHSIQIVFAETIFFILIIYMILRFLKSMFYKK